MAKVSKRTRLAYVTVAALSSTFMSSEALADCISQAPVDALAVICGGPGANGWNGAATNGLKVTVDADATVTNNIGGPALISTGTGSSVINFSGNFNNGVGATFGIDAGSPSGAALNLGGGTQFTNNSNANMRGTIVFGNATGSAVNIINNNYSPSGGNNLTGALSGNITSAGNTTFNNQGVFGASANNSFTQTGAGTVIIKNGVDGGFVASSAGVYTFQNGVMWNPGGTVISTVGNTTLTNYGGGNAMGALINGNVIVGTGGTGTSTIVNGKAGSNATILGNVTMSDKDNTLTNDGTITGNVTMNGTGTNTYNAGSSGSSGDNGLRLPGSQVSGNPPTPNGTVTGTLQGSTAAGSVNILNLNGTGSSTLQVGSVIKGINTVNKNESGLWIIRATLDGTPGALKTVNLKVGELGIVDADFLGTAATTVNLSNSTLLTFYGDAAGVFNGNIVDATGATNGQVNVHGLVNTTTFGGTNTYSGATVVDGKLATGSNGALSANSAFTIENGGTLTVNNQNTIKSLDDSGSGPNTVNLNGVNTSLTVGSGDFGDANGVITGTGKLIKTGTGTLTLSNGAGNVNTYSGGTTVSGGTLQGVAGWGLQGNIVNNANVKFTGSGTYAGNMTGTGTVNLTGGGSTTFSGTGNTYSGDTTIDAGTALFADAGSLSPNSGVIANGTLDLNGDNTIKNLGGASTGVVDFDGQKLTLAGIGSYTFNGELQGDATAALQVNNGGGSWTFGSAGTTSTPLNSFTNNGNTILNGSLRATTGVNSTTGTLSGNGTFTGAFTNNGAIRPGSSPGILNFVGSYAQGVNGTYFIDINANNSAAVTAGVDYDRIAVSGAPGTASLAGNATIVQNGGQFVHGTVYTILTTTSPGGGATDGLISGSFNFTNNVISPFITLTPSIVNNNVAHTGAYNLTVVRTAYNSVANNPNQAAVAGLTSSTGLQGLVGLSSANAAIARIDNMSASDARAFFDQISPEPYAAYVRALQDQGNLFTRQVAHRMAQTGGEKDAKMGVWGNLYGQWGNGKNKSFRFGSDQDIKGGALGVDGTMGESLTLGAAVGYSEAKVDYNLGNSKGKSKSWQVGGYASYHPGNVVADLQVAYVHGKVRAKKGVSVGSGFSATSGVATASTSGNTFKVVGTVGYEIGSETLGFRPFVGVDFTSGNLKGFREGGTLGALTLNVRKQELDRTDLLLGFKFAPQMGSLQPYADATLRYGLSRNDGRVRAFFNGIGSDQFTVSAQRSAKMQGELDAGLAYGIGKNASIFFGYEGTLRKSLTEHGVNGGVKLAF